MTAIEAAPPPAAAGARRLAWRQAEVVERAAETHRTTTLVVDVPGWPGHLAGQHVDVRLTADDGYQAQRSYSIASPPEEPRLALTVALTLPRPPPSLSPSYQAPYQQTPLVDTKARGGGGEGRVHPAETVSDLCISRGEVAESVDGEVLHHRSLTDDGGDLDESDDMNFMTYGL